MELGERKGMYRVPNYYQNCAQEAETILDRNCAGGPKVTELDCGTVAFAPVN